MENHHHLQEVTNHLAPLPAIVPSHRKAARHPYSFADSTFNEQLLVWDHIWNNTNNFRVRVHATFFLERHLKTPAQLEAMWPVVAKWQDTVDDWGLCDALAKVYTKILVVVPEKVYRTLKQWNEDKSLWKRRQSVVSLLYYAKGGGVGASRAAECLSKGGVCIFDQTCPRNQPDSLYHLHREDVRKGQKQVKSTTQAIKYE